MFKQCKSNKYLYYLKALFMLFGKRLKTVGEWLCRLGKRLFLRGERGADCKGFFCENDWAKWQRGGMLNVGLP
jgi:hypothetical protein